VSTRWVSGERRSLWWYLAYVGPYPVIDAAGHSWPQPSWFGRGRQDIATFSPENVSELGCAPWSVSDEVTMARTAKTTTP
jgi:hypothetical protein